MRRVLSLLAVLVAGYVILVGALWALQRQLLFLPDRTAPNAAAAGLPDMASVRLRTPDGLDLLAWWRPPSGDQFVIVYLHGNGGHIGYRGSRVRPFLDRGMGVLLVSYRGYGGNPGSPSENGLLADGRGALEFLTTQGIGTGRTVLYGESLGSTVAVRLASEQADAGQPVAALVLEAPLSSVVDVATHHYPWVPIGLLLKDRLEAAAHIDRTAAPILILHGQEDRVVPIRFGQKLYDAARQPKEAVWLEGAGHEDLPAWGSQAIVLEFLHRHTLGGNVR
jgi:uncharacterized protein